MKAKAKKLILDLFVENRYMIPSSEIFERSVEAGISNKVMTAALKEMDVQTTRKDNACYRYWPMRNLFYETQYNIQLPDIDSGNDGISDDIEEVSHVVIETEPEIVPVEESVIEVVNDDVPFIGEALAGRC